MAEGQFPGAPAGFNGRMSVGKYGRRFVRVQALQFGLRIISNEASAAAQKSFYPIVTTGSSFSMTLEWKSVAERDSFNAWMRQYMRRIASNDDSIDGFMSIEVPDRNFVRTAVPEGELTYDDSVVLVKPVTNLSFVGASGAIEVDASAKKLGLSYLILPKSPVARHFYPTGNQIKGEATDSIFGDGVPPAPAALTGISDPPRDPYFDAGER